MQDQLRLALIQSDLVWENPKANRKQFKEKIESIKGEVDVIVLPEMFTSAFTMNATAVAETMDGKTMAWLKEISKSTNAAIMGSLIIKENSNYFNRLVFVEPSGEVAYYNKRHTFTLAGEDKVFSKGNKKIIIDYKGWKICPQVCYDLRFPVWARNVEEYDVLIYVANWPKPRIYAWDTLLKARAIENMCYCIGVNRVGLDDKQNEYCGHTAIYDVLGSPLTPFKPNKEFIEVVSLERNHINYYRNKLNFLDDKDAFNLH
ncbi:amidohydrolase [Aestuariibaculum sediminum]|uniref:Omega-amidase YafV n=1 Tax=Aestuariibaculum sediminum TaxID=2770637 RepID=A0A8J6Q176_9FLAO|nr:amidohydrolase [Aestuariibaculum sediminum]MBD0830950.1 amidohydrolase [Aestuariibaculum sediminum]